MKALVLSGGGARGAYEAGVAKALAERERFDMFCGVSIGAINAALLAAGRHDDALERFWLHEFPEQVLTLFPHVPRLRRIANDLSSMGVGGPWDDALRFVRAASELRFFRQLGRIHKTTLPAVAKALDAMIDFSQLRQSLLVGATNVSRGTAAAFYAFTEPPAQPPHRQAHINTTEYREMTQENFIMSLLASSAMPGLFSPIELDFLGYKSQYADGCIVYNSPLSLAIDSGATEITVLFVDPAYEAGPTGPDGGLARMAGNIVMLWQQRSLDYEVRLAQAMNEIVRLGGDTEKRYIEIRYVRPEKELDLDILAFDDIPGMKRAFELGMADGAKTPAYSLERPKAIEAGAIVEAAAKAQPSFWDAMRNIRMPWSQERSA